jgi:hypothetical protein
MEIDLKKIGKGMVVWEGMVEEDEGRGKRTEEKNRRV